ncbi:hypothetical protein K474DRAFT_1656223 [Panus rudis PR-1116 ss-1]|nr:hypothetical protein K474DRAFT_1656223 [Panus rudis PR-1116 ss-1]
MPDKGKQKESSVHKHENGDGLDDRPPEPGQPSSEGEGTVGSSSDAGGEGRVESAEEAGARSLPVTTAEMGESRPNADGGRCASGDRSSRGPSGHATADAHTGTTTDLRPSPPSRSSASTPAPICDSSSQAPSASTVPAMHPDALLPLLHCPLCLPPRLLDAPVTLRCGHTVCAQHLMSSEPPSGSSFLSSWIPARGRDSSPLPTCPIPTCTHAYSSANAVPTLAVHPDAQVNFIPPPSPPANPVADHAHAGSRDDDSRPAQVDVTLSKVVSLVSQARYWFSSGSAPPPRPPVQDAEEETDWSDAEEDDRPSLDYASDGDVDRSMAADGDRTRPGPSSSSARHALLALDGSPFPGPSSLSGRSRRPRQPSSSPSPERPKKRSRLARRIRTPIRPGAPSSPQDAAAKFEKELLTELSCEICFGLLFQPVTTPCQHTFCSRCLHRSLDHSNACPLCRSPLPGYSYFQEHPYNKVILAIILNAFPGDYASRGEALQEEERDSRLDTPIFVCQLSFPGMPMFLNFYEPRYRLMLRRCLATPRPRFGMIPPPRSQPFAGASSSSQQNYEYGTMLSIRNVQVLPDGQCRVEAWGTHRFRILERGVKDGYAVARVERVEDVDNDEEFPGPSLQRQDAGSEDLDAVLESSGRALGVSRTGPSNAAPSSNPSSSRGRSGNRNSSDPPPTADTGSYTNEELMSICHDFLGQLRAGAAPWVVDHLSNSFVPMPEDPAHFSFWMALLLPIDEHEKAKLLPIKSPRLRLRLIVHWINQFRGQWFPRSYTAFGSPSQVVLWWLYHLMTRVVLPFIWPAIVRRRGPIPFGPDNIWVRPDAGQDVGLRGRRLLRYAAYLVLLLAIVRAQISLRQSPIENE